MSLRDAPVLAVVLELVKMRVGPAHDYLKGAVKTAQLDGTGNRDHSGKPTF
jgi:hypothetical protein